MAHRTKSTPASWPDLVGPANFNLPRATSPSTGMASPFAIFVLPSGRFLAAWRCSKFAGPNATEYCGTVRRAFPSYDAAETFCILGDD